MSADNADFLDVRGASDYARSLLFRVAPKSRNKLRSLGGGPSFRRFGRRVLYRRSTFHAWLVSQLRNQRDRLRKAGIEHFLKRPDKCHAEKRNAIASNATRAK
jgi:hypothetical protein